MSTINAVNTRLVTVAASHVHRLAHGCLLPAREAEALRLEHTARPVQAHLEPV